MCTCDNALETASILDQLYQLYDQSRTESETIRQGFLKLETLLGDFSLDKQNEASFICNSIADELARLAFREGVRTGIQLAKELTAI